MAVVNCFSDGTGRDIYSGSATYATARTGGGTRGVGFGDPDRSYVGQRIDFYCVEAFESFDTSAIRTTDVVTAATLYMNVVTAGSAGVGFRVNVYAYDFGPSVSTADFVSGAATGSLTLVAYADVTTSTPSGYLAFTTVDLPRLIKRQGITRLLLISSRHEAGSSPGATEEIGFYNGTRTGTAQDPYLAVTVTPAPEGAPVWRDQMSLDRTGLLGEASYGGVWLGAGGDTAWNNVSGGKVTATITGGYTGTGYRVAHPQVRDMRVRARIRLSANPVLSDAMFVLTARNSGNSWYECRFIFKTTGAIDLNINGYDAGWRWDLKWMYGVSTWADVTGWWWIEFALSGNDPNVMEGRLWKDGGYRPAEPQITFSETYTNLNGANCSGIYVSGSNASETRTYEIDYFETLDLSRTDTTGSIIDTGWQGSTGGTDTSVTVPFPFTPIPRRLLVSALAVDKTAGTITVPSGWTKVGTDMVTASVSMCVATKVADGSETQAIWTISTAAGGGGLHAWVGQVDGDTVDVYAQTTPSDTAVTSRSSGTTGATSRPGLAMAFFASDSFSNTENRSYSNGFAEWLWTADYYDFPGSPGLYIATKTVAAGATPETTMTVSDTGDQIHGMVLVVTSSAVAVTPIDARWATYGFSGRRWWKFWQSATASGGPTLLAISGAIASTGALVRGVRSRLAGASAPAGALIRQPRSILSGAVASSGTFAGIRSLTLAVSGAIASAGSIVRQAQQRLTGSAVSSGALVRQAQQILSGSTSSAGVLSRRSTQFVTGSIASTGSLVRRAQQRLAGSAASSGAVRWQVQQRLSGTTATAGSLVRRVSTTLTGATTSAGALVRQVRSSLAGTITSSGSLTRKVITTLTGAIASAGAAVAVRIPGGSVQSVNVSGAISSAGSLVRQANLRLAGTSASAGALARKVITRFTASAASTGATRLRPTQTFSGAVASSGSLVRRANLALAASIASTGALVRSVRSRLGGTVASSGTLVRGVRQTLSGWIATAGALRHRVGQSFAGSVASTGTIVRGVQQRLVGSVASAGSLATSSGARLLTLAVSGSVATAGVLRRTVRLTFAGAIRSLGILGRFRGRGSLRADGTGGSRGRGTGTQRGGSASSSDRSRGSGSER